MMKEINQMSDREAMGLPECFVDAKTQEWSSLLYWLRGQSKAELVQLIENKESSTAVRWAAGQLLALFGDPRINTVDPKMIEIPEFHQFQMGIPFSEVTSVTESLKDLGIKKEWIEKEAPQFVLPLKKFKIAKYPVTHQEYRQFLLDTQHTEIPSTWFLGAYPLQKSNHPVNTVSADSAAAYAKWLSGKTGRKFRLPTEAEWEFAAKGFSSKEFPWGESFRAGLSNTVEFGLQDTSPVGIFPEGDSDFGVSDMAGNVEEYTSDDYAVYPGGHLVADDLLVSLGSYKVARGGSFTRYRDLARNTRRHGAYQKNIYVMGFRLVEEY